MKKILLLLISTSVWAAPTQYVSKDDATNTVYLQDCPGTCAEMPQRDGQVVPLDELSWSQVDKQTCTDGTPAIPETPATYDADGNELTPAVPGTPAVDPVCTTSQVWVVNFDQAKKTAKDAAAAAKAADDADMALKIKQIQIGQRVIARFRILNDKKGLTDLQKGALLKDASVQAVESALLVGNLDVAKVLISGLTVNDPLITQNDKDTLVALINSSN